jgi:nitrogen fixation protein FixH
MLSLVSLQAQTPGKKPARVAPPVIAFATEPNPPKSGDVEFRVTVKDATGQPISDAGVSVQLVMPSMRDMRTDVKLPSAGAGVYRGTGQIEMSGRWDATLTVTRDGQRPATKRVMVIVQ